MNASLFTIYLRPIARGYERVLSIFFVDQALRLEDLDAALARELQGVGPVDAVHFVGYEREIGSLRCWLARPDDVLFDRLRGVLGSNSETLRLFSFNPALGKHTCTYRDGRPVASDDLIVAERRGSLIAAFCSAGGEESAPAGTHYAKTSEKHCDRFLRVSNVLEHGANVRLVAFWLLPDIWNTAARHVVVDTSGIYSVALTALSEAAKLGGQARQPLVWSHRSHEGVADIPAHVARDAVFLVSASTSNGLAIRLLKAGARPGHVITLFSLSNEHIDGHVTLCDLRSNGEVGIKPIQNQDASSCSYCKRHFHLIGIQGDQFSIAPPRVTSIEIRSDDLHDKERSTLSALAGLRAFFAYRRRDDDRLCSVGLSVEPLLADPVHEKCRALQDKMREKWRSFVRRSQTVSLRTVVAASYPGSVALAQGIGEQARQALQDVSKALVVDPTALRQLNPQTGTSTIVVSSCVDETKELLGISRTLRDVQEGGTISYLSVAQLMAPKQYSDRLRSNLTHGAQGPGTFSYLNALEIPIDCYEEQPSWRAELDELQRLCAWADQAECDIPAEVETRIARLQQAPAFGLVDDLFWPNASGEALRLRSDFALIDGSLREPGISQADLFAVISVVLTALRHSPDGSRRLAHNGYERAVLAPSNFDRFSDGVLQACLLRAARPKDLAYGACEEGPSEQMLAILMHALPDASSPEKSEALIEFTLALMTGRMTLKRQATVTFADALVSSTEGKWSVVALMGTYLKFKIDGRGDLRQ